MRRWLGADRGSLKYHATEFIAFSLGQAVTTEVSKHSSSRRQTIWGKMKVDLKGKRTGKKEHVIREGFRK